MSLFKILLTILGIWILYGLIKFFIKIVLPLIIAVRTIKKAQSQFAHQQNAYHNQNTAPEGEVTLEKPKTKDSKIIRDDMGQTVDFEEIE